jgi:betaine-aldehyde dehydrogenase
MNGTSIADLDLAPYIDGAFRRPREPEDVDIINPATEEKIVTLSLGGAADIDAAVVAARAAFPGWRDTSGPERARFLLRLADLVEQHADALARLEALDIGKPVGQPLMVDVPNTVATLRYMAGWADRITGEVIPSPAPDGRPTHTYVRHEPLGVIGAIVPWNTPLMLASWKIAAAVCTGNTVVMKPAEIAPLSVLYLARLIDEAGFPRGTVNIVPGTGPNAGEALVGHPGVAKVSFTGSTAVGRRILQQAAETFRPVALELGGKSPHVVLADADVEAAVTATAIGLFFNQGQVCAAGTRVFVHRSLYPDFVAALTSAADSQVLGDPFDPATTVGPVVSASQRDRVQNWIAKGTAEGARQAAGGDVAGPGFFVRPTIFADATNDMAIARNEIFGPVGVVIPFDDPAEAIRLANDSDYGLAASIWTSNISDAHLLAEQVEAGTVWVNGWGGLNPGLPWGGVKHSGMGKELGWSGVLSYTREKVVSITL